MMTTVAQMIEWLKTLPPDAEVVCGYETSRAYNVYMEYGPVDTEYSTVLDYRDPKWADSKMAGRVIVQLEADK